MHGGSLSALRRFTPDVQVQVSYGTQSSQPSGKTEPLCAIKKKEQYHHRPNRCRRAARACGRYLHRAPPLVSCRETNELLNFTISHRPSKPSQTDREVSGVLLSSHSKSLLLKTVLYHIATRRDVRLKTLKIIHNLLA